MSFSLSHPCSLLSIILLYNEEAVSRTLCSLSASVSRVAAIGAERALYKFAIWFLIQLVIFIIGFLFEYFWFVVNSSAFIYL